MSPFYGNLSPFYGPLSPFWGNLSPFYGNLSPFWGNLSPFTTPTDAGLNALYGTANNAFWGSGPANPFVKNPSPNVNFSQINGFWNTEGASFAALQQNWSTAQTAADYQNIANQLQSTVLDPAGTFWGKAVAAPLPKVGQSLTPPAPPSPILKGATGVSAGASTSSFGLNFANSVLTNAGVTFNANGSINSSSLAGLSPTQQAMLFMNLYDGLMSYSGTGHVDWWMGATGWSPNLASIVGSVYKADYPVVIGMLDFTITPSGATSKGALTQYGSSVFANGHGAAVGSLIMGSVDGSGVMGILPAQDANVIVYNPYDSTGTTNWTDVGTGIQVLSTSIYGNRKSGAPVGVINASLGVPGWTLNPGWNDALSSGAAFGHNLVVAAGNEGVQQTTDVPWNFAKNPTLIVVGSVGLDGTISNFSNTPGEACLVDTASGVCDKLKNHFIVAPGELILVSDGNGGVTRQSGTSLAAPLVSGAIALLQARWPWLGYYPTETAQIILKSATPKGTNPGADPIYGVGELNIAASQAPLNWNNVTFTQVTGSGGKQIAAPVTVSQVITQVQSGTQAVWNTSQLYFTALETVGNTHRDFQIPMSSSLLGQLVNTEAGQQQFQSYLSTNLQSWVAGGGHFADASAVQKSMLGFMQSSTPIAKVAGMDLRLKMAPSEMTYGFRSNGLPVNTDMALVGGLQTLRFGYGQGAAALDGHTAFTQTSDYQIDRGGANPLLGLASGGAYADWRMAVGKKWAVNFGLTQRRSVRDISVFGPMIQTTGASNYTASAEHFGVDYSPIDRLVIHTSITRLNEDHALLGVQSLQNGALQNGSTTNGATVGFDFEVSPTVAFSASGTVTRTDAKGLQSIHTSDGGLIGSAGEMALTKSSLFDPLDRLRFSVSKPMQVTSGNVEYADYGVVDRQTGALGVINESVAAGGSRTPLVAEMFYGRLLPSQSAEVSVFFRAGANTDDLTSANKTAVMVGSKYRLVF